MFFRFSTHKTTQAAGVLLKQASCRQMSYLRLLKLLYIADREHLRESRRPIIGTRTIAMKNGPLHGEVYDLIKGEHCDAPLWSHYIRRAGYQVKLTKDPGVSELSAAEVRRLTGIAERYADTDDWTLVEVTHGFPEWVKNYPDTSANTSETIPFEDLIEVVGLSAEKDEILEDAREETKVDALLAGLRRQ